MISDTSDNSNNSGGRYRLRERRHTRALIRRQAQEDISSEDSLTQHSQSQTTRVDSRLMSFHQPSERDINASLSSLQQPMNVTNSNTVNTSNFSTSHFRIAQAAHQSSAIMNSRVLQPRLLAPLKSIIPQSLPVPSQQQQLLYFADTGQTRFWSGQQIAALSIPNGVRPGPGIMVPNQPHAIPNNLYHTTGAHTMPQVAHMNPNNQMGMHGNNAQASQVPHQFAPPLPMHPDVRFAKHAFYDVLAELHRTTTLLCQNIVSRSQEQTMTFHLSPAQAERIAVNRKKNILTNKVDYQVQVQLRFAKLIANTEQEDNFPPVINVKVNRTAVSLPPIIPTNKPGQDAKRPGRPLNITGQCRISPTVPNSIVAAWGHDNAQNYCAGIFLVHKLSPEDLIERLQRKGIKPVEYSKSMMKEKMSSEDLEVAVTDLHASLLCPLGKCRIRVPLRAVTCKHLQCFDAFIYLAMNEKKPTWKCPFCDGPAQYGDLYIDGLFKDILEKASFGIEKVQFSNDGSWSAVDDSIGSDVNNTVVGSGSKSNASSNAAATNLNGKTSGAPIATGYGTAAGVTDVSSSAAVDGHCESSADEPVTVDLTCSDDEDNDCLPPPVLESVAAISVKVCTESVHSNSSTPSISHAVSSSSPEIICLDDSEDEQEAASITTTDNNTSSVQLANLPPLRDGAEKRPFTIDSVLEGPPCKSPCLPSLSLEVQTDFSVDLPLTAASLCVDDQEQNHVEWLD